MSGSVSSVEGELNSIVKEYLEYLGLAETAKCFEEECQKNSKPIQENAGGSYKDERIQKIQNELFKSFNEGNYAQFFSTWDSYICRDVREGDSLCQKLEFQLHVYFAVYPLHHPDKYDKDDAESSMYKFRQFLESKGYSLSETNEFLLYYALPYVSNPQSHPSFNELFKESWVLDLRNHMETFLWEALREVNQGIPQSRLIDLYYCNDMELKDVRQELQSVEKRLDDSEKQSISQARQLSKLQSDYRKLMGVTAELITALESAVRGDMVDLDCVLTSCGDQFPEMFQLPRSDSSQVSMDESLSRAQQLRHLLSQQSNTGRDHLLHKLDYSKVKQDLISAEVRQKCLLIQALRWKITKSSLYEQRDCVMLSFISNDLLGCSRRQSEYCNRALHIVRSASQHLRQTFARFLNALASFSKGRSYLARNPQLLAVLTDCLISEHPRDIITRDMVLGTLQKLSLRRALQVMMINQGMVEWLINMLDNGHSLTDYGLEYAVALFMNLCLHAEGKAHCLKMMDRVLQILEKLLGHENIEILPYVNGALYSLLSLEDVRKEALEMGMKNTLEEMMRSSSPETQRQLEYVYKKLTTDDDSDTKSKSSDEDEDEDEDDDEEAEIEPEIDNDDPVEALPGELCGEQLLMSCYVQVEQSRLSSGTALESSTRTPASSVPAQPRRNSTSSTDQLTIQNESCVSESEEVSLPLENSLTVDEKASELVQQITGEERTVVAASSTPSSPDRSIQGSSVKEYAVAFSSRPKIPRTPEPGAARTSLTSTGKRIHSRDGRQRTSTPEYSTPQPPKRSGASTAVLKPKP